MPGSSPAWAVVHKCPSLVPRRSDCFSCAKYCCVYDAGCRARFPFVFRPRATSRVVHATVFRARKAIRAPGDEAANVQFAPICLSLAGGSLVPRRSDCFSCAKYCCVYDAGCRARPEHEREAWPRATSRVVHATVFRARKAIRAPGDEAGQAEWTPLQGIWSKTPHESEHEWTRIEHDRTRIEHGWTGVNTNGTRALSGYTIERKWTRMEHGNSQNTAQDNVSTAKIFWLWARGLISGRFIKKQGIVENSILVCF